MPRERLPSLLQHARSGYRAHSSHTPGSSDGSSGAEANVTWQSEVAAASSRAAPAEKGDPFGSGGSSSCR